MEKTRVYMQKGWTIVEWSSEEGHSSYWITNPRGKWRKSFATKMAARLYWRKHMARIMRADTEAAEPTEADGIALVESCGLNWDDLDDFERSMWLRASAKK